MTSIFKRLICVTVMFGGVCSVARGADVIAVTGSAFLHAEDGAYLGYASRTDTETFTHGVNGVFHSQLQMSYVPSIVISADDRWYFDFAAPLEANPANPSGRIPLQVGFYDNAVRYPFNSVGVPGMDISVNGSGYNTLSGWFKVLDIAYDENKQVSVLAVDFAEYGESTDKTGPAVYGSLRFNSAIPLTTTIPELTSLAQFGLGLIGLLIAKRVSAKCL